MLLARLRRSHIHVVIARRGSLPTRQRIIGTASDHGTRQKSKGQRTVKWTPNSRHRFKLLS